MVNYWILLTKVSTIYYTASVWFYEKTSYFHLSGTNNEVEDGIFF